MIAAVHPHRASIAEDVAVYRSLGLHWSDVRSILGAPAARLLGRAAAA